MKKIFSIVLALGMVLVLSVVATPVAANVTTPVVVVAPDTVGTEAEYEIVFNITSTLAIGATISIEFPAGTTVPTTYETGDVTVEGWDISSGDISVAGQVVTITLPTAIGAPDEVTVVFKMDADITNPATDGDYTLSVRTSKETTWMTSEKYTIRLSNKSTYEFVYQPPEPEEMMIWVNEPAAVNVTLQTRVLGLAGYNHTLIHFWKEGPGDVLFEGWDEDMGMWHSFPNEGYWGPGGGFPVAADYSVTTPFKLTFDAVGVYTIVLQLLDLADSNNVLAEGEPTVAVTGVSVNVTLNKGWNLMSLPIVPDSDNIEVVLADIMDDVISVHYYSATYGTWRIYAPPDHTSLTELKDGNAYWINMSAAANLTVVGQAIAAPGYQGGLPRTYPVVEGWNMIGFKSMDPMKAEDYLDGTDCVRIYGFDLTEGGWFSLTSSHNMTPGLGYWVAFSEPGTIYP